MGFHPVDVHFRTLAVLSRTALGYRLAECGLLSHDGELLTLLPLDGGSGGRAVTDKELAAILPVTPRCRIPECVGFDLMIFREP